MLLPQPLQPATLILREKRFLAHAQLPNGRRIIAHCPNPGSMLGGLAQPGNPILLSQSNNPKRKLPLTWEISSLTHTNPHTLVGVNTMNANRIAQYAFSNNLIPQISSPSSIQPEIPLLNSRIDFLLSFPHQPRVWVEVKSVTLSRTPGLAEFPDSKTSRGAKHLRTLAQHASQSNDRVLLLYLIQRNDCSSFAVAADIDPDYALAHNHARQLGLISVALPCRLSSTQITPLKPIPISNPLPKP